MWMWSMGVLGLSGTSPGAVHRGPCPPWSLPAKGSLGRGLQPRQVCVGKVWEHFRKVNTTRL